MASASAAQKVAPSCLFPCSCRSQGAASGRRSIRCCLWGIALKCRHKRRCRRSRWKPGGHPRCRWNPHLQCISHRDPLLPGEPCGRCLWRCCQGEDTDEGSCQLSPAEVGCPAAAAADMCAECGNSQVFVELTPPDFSLPWQRQPSAAATASAVMVREAPLCAGGCNGKRSVASALRSRVLPALPALPAPALALACGLQVHGPHGENWVLTNAHAVDYATNVGLR